MPSRNIFQPFKFPNHFPYLNRIQPNQRLSVTPEINHKPKIGINNGYILNTDRNHQKEIINVPIKIQENQVENNYIYNQQNNYINYIRQNYHKENLEHKRNYQRIVNPLGKNKNNSNPHLYFAFNKEKANYKNDNILYNIKIAEGDIYSGENILKQKYANEKQFNNNNNDIYNFDINLYEEVVSTVPKNY